MTTQNTNPTESERKPVTTKKVTFKASSLNRLAKIIDGLGLDVYVPLSHSMDARKNFVDVYNGGSGLWYANGDSKNPVKLGKVLSAIDFEAYFGSYDSKEIAKEKAEKIDSKVILRIVEGWKEKYTIDLDMLARVQVSDRLSWVYDMRHDSSGSVGTSCMRGCGEYYEQLDSLKGCRIAYLTDHEDANRLIGRAILWDCEFRKWGIDEYQSITFMDRIYYSNDTVFNVFKAWAVKNEYYRKQRQSYDSHYDLLDPNDNEVEGSLRIKFNWDESRYMPYMDTLCDIVHMDGEEYLTNHDGDGCHQFHDTDGSLHLTTCDGCGNRYDEDYEGAYVDCVGYYVCDSCLSDGFVYCDNTSDYIPLDDAVEIDGEWYHIDDTVTDIHGNYILERHAVMLDNGEYCLEDEAILTQNTDQWLHEDDSDLIQCDCGTWFDNSSPWDCDNCGQKSDDADEDIEVA